MTSAGSPNNFSDAAGSGFGRGSRVSYWRVEEPSETLLSRLALGPCRLDFIDVDTRRNRPLAERGFSVVPDTADLSSLASPPRLMPCIAATISSSSVGEADDCELRTGSGGVGCDSPLSAPSTDFVRLKDRMDVRRLTIWGGWIVVHAGLMGDYAATQRPSERSDRRGDSAGVLRHCLRVLEVGRKRLVVISQGSSS